jgi:hypothetical protein
MQPPLKLRSGVRTSEDLGKRRHKAASRGDRSGVMPGWITENLITDIVQSR